MSAGATIKALPLWQPWATLVAVGAKRIETRDFPPQRIGLRPKQRIAIHACKRTSELWLCAYDEFADCLPCVAEDLPLGALLAVCTLDRASEVTAESAAALRERNPQEYAFGHYAPGRWAWVLKDVVQLDKPVPFKGSQGTFDVPADLLTISAVSLPPSPELAQGVLL